MYVLKLVRPKKAEHIGNVVEPKGGKKASQVLRHVLFCSPDVDNEH